MTPKWFPVFALAGALLSFSVCVAGIRWYVNKSRRVKAAYPSKKLAWDQAMACWARSYYCFRDDVVFDPDNGETCRPQALKRFLYAHTGIPDPDGALAAAQTALDADTFDRAWTTGRSLSPQAAVTWGLQAIHAPEPQMSG